MLNLLKTIFQITQSYLSPLKEVEVNIVLLKYYVLFTSSN